MTVKKLQYLDDKADAGGDNDAIDDVRLDCGDVKKLVIGVDASDGAGADGVGVVELTNGVGDWWSVVVGVGDKLEVEPSDVDVVNRVGVANVDGVAGDVVAPEAVDVMKAEGTFPAENVDAGSPV